jgi:GTP-binding protein
MAPFAHASFLRAAGRVADFPELGPTEIVFAGRSNVGKSSAINAIVGRKALARTSKTPGRTQTINFYSIDERARMVDLPGYGYARVPQAMRAAWRSLVDDYLRGGRPIAGVVLVMDARHPLTPLDQQLVRWLAGRPLLALLSKADKLSRNAQQALLADMRLRMRESEVMLFSSVTRQGVESCCDLLVHWLEQAAEIKSPR